MEWDGEVKKRGKKARTKGSKKKRKEERKKERKKEREKESQPDLLLLGLIYMLMMKTQNFKRPNTPAPRTVEAPRHTEALHFQTLP